MHLIHVYFKSYILRNNHSDWKALVTEWKRGSRTESKVKKFLHWKNGEESRTHSGWVSSSLIYFIKGNRIKGVQILQLSRMLSRICYIYGAVVHWKNKRSQNGSPVEPFSCPQDGALLGTVSQTWLLRKNGSTLKKVEPFFRKIPLRSHIGSFFFSFSVFSIAMIYI